MTRALIQWLATAGAIIALIAGFNVGVDPFGYFGTNKIGFYFSSERQFKQAMVKAGGYNAILLGDSRMAFTDPSYIDIPGYRFLNAGVGGASLAEQLQLLRSADLTELRLVVLGMLYTDLNDCELENVESEDRWSAIRFAASWSQFSYAVRALFERIRGRSSQYRTDGTRLIAEKVFFEATLGGKTEQYWEKIRSDVPGDLDEPPEFDLAESCAELLRSAKRDLQRKGVQMLIVFWPRNGDFLRQVNWGADPSRVNIGRFLGGVRELVPHVADFTLSAYSASENFWQHDSMHFKPRVGAQMIESAIRRFFPEQARRP